MWGQQTEEEDQHVGGCQKYGPFLGALNIRCRFFDRDPKRDHNFDSHPCGLHAMGPDCGDVWAACWCKSAVCLRHVMPWLMTRVQYHVCSDMKIPKDRNSLI